MNRLCITFIEKRRDAGLAIIAASSMGGPIQKTGVSVFPSVSAIRYGT